MYQENRKKYKLNCKFRQRDTKANLKEAKKEIIFHVTRANRERGERIEAQQVAGLLGAKAYAKEVKDYPGIGAK